MSPLVGITEISSKLEREIRTAILKRAVLLEKGSKTQEKEKKKEKKKKKGILGFGKG